MWILRIIALAAALLWGSAALGQPRDSPRIAQPINTVELRRYGDILGLSDDQRLAVEATYDGYLDAFDPLRREMIEAAVAHPQGTRTGEEFTGLLPGFVARTEALDESFFAGVDPLLIEAQRERLSRVRDLRTRTMLCNIDALGRFIGDSLPELREMLEGLDRPPEMLTPLTPALEEHERRFTVNVRKMFEATMRVCRSGAPYDAAAKDLIECVHAQRAINRKLVDTQSPSLPEDIRRRWRGEFLIRVYGRATESAHMWSRAQTEAALATNLSEAERAAINDLLASATRIEEQALSRLMQLVDEQAIRPAPPGGAVPHPAYYQTISSIQQEVMAQDAELRKSLTTLLGAERFKALVPASRTDLRSHDGLYSSCGITVSVGRVYRAKNSSGVPMSRADPLVPPPLTAADVQAIAASLGLDQAQQATAIERFQTYAKSLEESLAPLRESAFRASMSVQPPADAAQDPLAWAKTADDARSKMRDVIQAATAQLLEEIRVMGGAPVEEPAWQRIVRMRERGMMTLDLALHSPHHVNRSGELDIARLLMPLRLDAQTWQAIDPIIAAYETELSSILMNLFEAFRKNSLSDVARRAGWRGDDGQSYEIMRGRRDSLHEQHQAIATLNRETVARLIPVLPSGTGAALQSEYERAAYPRAFADRRDSEAILGRAAALNGLSPDQQERISELRAEFDSAGAKVRREMIDVCAAVRPDLPSIGWTLTPERAAGQERFALEFDRLSDEQAQVNRRALRGLRLILTPAQMQQVERSDP